MNLTSELGVVGKLLETGVIYQDKMELFYDATVFKNNQRVGPKAFISKDGLSVFIIFHGASGCEYQYETFASRAESETFLSGFVDNFHHNNLASLPPEDFSGKNSDQSLFVDLLAVGASKLNKLDVVYDATVTKIEGGQQIKYGPIAYSNGDDMCLLQTIGQDNSNWKLITGAQADIETAINNFISTFRHDDLSVFSVDNFGLNPTITYDQDHYDTYQSAFDYFMYKPHQEYDGNAVWDSELQAWVGGGMDGITKIPLALQINGDWADGYRPTIIRFDVGTSEVTGLVIRDAAGNFHYARSSILRTGVFEVNLDYTSAGDIEGILLFTTYGLCYLADISFYTEVLVCPTPTFSPVDGTAVSNASPVMLSCTDPGATIYYKYDDEPEYGVFDSETDYPIVTTERRR